MAIRIRCHDGPRCRSLKFRLLKYRFLRDQVFVENEWMEKVLHWLRASWRLVVPLARWCVIPACIVSVCIISSSAATGDEANRDAKIAFFESRIRPVLVEHCYACHNSAESDEAGLSVDHRAGLRDGGDGGKLIVPGDAAKSRLIAILKHEIDGLEMPQDGAKLSDRVVTDFEQWIDSGAEDPRETPPSLEALTDATSWEATLRRRKEWWSFRPIRRVDPPASSDWSDHPVDRFVASKFNAAGLVAARPADPSVLIRRLFINLIGIPPTAVEFERWSARYGEVGSADQSGVTEDLIDELLASDHFGERWARHWMDWIRYAESHGSEGDPSIDNAWFYRDYLIRAMNADVPYDQLVREHVAGDLLAEPRVNADLALNESVIGPSHWRMVFHGFAPTDALDEKVRFVDDQINAFSKAFLGLTVSCARCHDHKFDAISQKDYYALFGILASCRPGRSVIDLPERQQYGRDSMVALKRRIRTAIANDWSRASDSVDERILADPGLAGEAKSPQDVLNLVYRVKKQLADGATFSRAWKLATQRRLDETNERTGEAIRQWDLSEPTDYQRWTATGIGLPDRPSPAGEFAIASSGDVALTGVYPSGVYSHLLSAKHPARLTSEDFDLGEENELWVRAIGGGGSTVRYVVQDYPRNGTVYPVPKLKPTWNWQRFDMSYWCGDQVHVELTAVKDAPLLVGGDDRSWIGVTEARVIRKGTPPPKHRVAHADVILAKTAQRSPTSMRELAGLVAAAVSDAVDAWRDGTASDQQAEFLDACIRQGVLPNEIGQLAEAKPLIEKYRLVETEIPTVRRVPGLEETTGRTQRLFVRGNHKKPGDLVPRRFLEAIDAKPFQTPNSGRLQLAEHVLADDNPLTRRVIVNRLWHHLFGKGIVATPDNFGRLGSQPTHPELLDWLATRMVAEGWSLKKMIRLLVTSKTWQLSSTVAADARQRDPENHLLTHAPVRRMEAEVIRDSLLSVSGRLNRDLFGGPVNGASPRRSVYVRVIRNSLDPFLRVFDFPEPFSTTGRRDVTNVPAQSLTMMNDVQVAQYASAFATRVLEDADLQTDESRIERMFVLGLARRPSDDEVRRAKAYLAATQEAVTKLRDQVVRFRIELNREQAIVDSILQPERERLVEQAKSQSGSKTSNLPKPIGRWEFEEDFGDAMDGMDGSPISGARIEAGALIVGGSAHVVTSTLKHSLREKTLEAWVKLDGLDQRGGGVMTVQTPNGVVFDSIVFGEREPRKWLAGSNGFSRTQGFQAPQEQEAENRFVHVAIVYQKDGTIVGYRDGKPYGQSYKSDGPYPFKAGEAIVSFGVRHLPATGNRMLAGRIDLAQLYDRALSAEEIAASASGQGFYVSEKQVLEGLSDAQRNRVETSQTKIDELRRQIDAIGSLPDGFGDQEVWADFARALFTLKEFIYVR